MSAFLTKMSDLHFDEKNLWENDSTRGDRKYLVIFSAVAVLILLIACINYMNLATARSSRRAKEVGLRKSLGSKRSELAKQFFYESMLMTLGSLVIALILVVILLQPFNQLAHKTFTLARSESIHDGNCLADRFVHGVSFRKLSGHLPVCVQASRCIEGTNHKRKGRRAISKKPGDNSIHCITDLDHFHIHSHPANGSHAKY